MVKDSFGRDWSLEDMKASMGAGWHPLIENLYQLCEEEGVDVFQVKEKFGGLRFYTGGASESIDSAIIKAEQESFKICEICGKDGLLRDDNGWLSVRCDDHRRNSK